MTAGCPRKVPALSGGVRGSLGEGGSLTSSGEMECK